MTYEYFSHNGQVLPAGQAVVPLADIEYAYGFGVYETVRFNGDKIYFLDDHCQRLLQSAKIIDLEHIFSADFVANAAEELVAKNQADTCNIKIMLIGGRTAEAANLYIMCLNPLFPRRELYKEGAKCTVFQHERNFPGAKTLNMLPSYLAYRLAKAESAYEALLINRLGCITEGTRSNFFAIKDEIISTPPEADVLPGITRAKVLEIARMEGFEVAEKSLPLDEINHYDGAFLTSTSAKIMPIKQIGDEEIGPPTLALQRLMKAFDDYLASV